MIYVNKLPVAPLVPSSPGSPVGPAGPLGPESPVAPVSPSLPSGPVNTKSKPYLVEPLQSHKIKLENTWLSSSSYTCLKVP